MAIDMTGQKCGNLTVIRPAGKKVSSTRKSVLQLWECRCDCGNTVIVAGSSLRSGHTQSCGWCQNIMDCGSYMKCTIKGGRSFLFDRLDIDLVSSARWSINRNGYVETKNSRICGQLHRLLMNPLREECVDHINGDSTDCRRSNLRISSYRDNSRNMKTPSSNTSGYKGVSYDAWSKRRKRFRASIRLNGISTSLGYFNNAEEAATAYNKAAVLHFGEYARLNVIGIPGTTQSVKIAKEEP